MTLRRCLYAGQSKMSCASHYENYSEEQDLLDCGVDLFLNRRGPTPGLEEVPPLSSANLGLFTTSALM